MISLFSDKRMGGLPTILLFILALPVLTLGQSNWTINYNQPNIWIRDNASSQIAILSNQMHYVDATDGSNRRMYRALPSPIEDLCWTMNFNFYAERGGNNGATGTCILGLTEGNNCPLNTCSSTNSNNSRSNESGLLVSILSDQSGAGVKFAVRIKNSTQIITTSPPVMPINYQDDYYLTLQRKKPDTLILWVYQDSSRTQPLPGTPSIGIIPAGLDTFNYVQHSTYPQGYPGRKLTGWVDNVTYTKNSCDNCPLNENIWPEKEIDLCLNSPKFLRVNYNDPIYQIMWSTGATGNQISIQNPGSYWVRIDSANCSWSDTLKVNNLYTPIPTHLPKDTSLCVGGIINLSQLLDDYSTDLGEIQMPNNRSIPFRDTFNYTIYSQCDSNITSIAVEWKKCNCSSISIPNAFTPNGDNINDKFEVKSDCDFDYYNLTIFNRWGSKIFQSFSIKNHWSGTFNGQKVPIGVYYYILKYKTKAVHKKRIGTITIVK